MHCELLVPALFGAPDSPPVPALERLLARGRAARQAPLSPEAWLARGFGLPEEPLAAGALTRLAEGGAPGAHWWLRTDPAHLRIERENATLIPAAALGITAAEAADFTGALNRHFAGEIEFHASRPDCWCARCTRPADLEAPAWHAVLTEIQMVLHAHPANAARANPINSLRCWGAGSLPERASSRWHSVVADEPIALGLARLAGTRHRALPADAHEWLERAPEEGRHLLVLDALRLPRELGDDSALAERIAALEARWFAPLCAALRSRRIGMLTVHVPDGGVAYETIRGDLRRFWRRARPLAAYRA